MGEDNTSSETQVQLIGTRYLYLCGETLRQERESFLAYILREPVPDIF